MKPPFPSFTSEWHNAPYPAISPSRPELSAAGKTIIISGAGSGIGRETTRAFAEAGAAHIAILGRRENLLQETKEAVEAEFPKTRVTVHKADVTQGDVLRNVASKVGKWDVLVLNAGYMSDKGPAATADVDDWWKGFEINVKGTVISLQAFLPSKREGAAVIGISTAALSFPGAMLGGMSSYAASKTALVKFFEVFAAENPDVHAPVLHPGVVATDMYDKSGFEVVIPKDQTDDVKLPAHFIVWSASAEARFTSGKFLYVNFDVDELKAKAKEMQETPALTANVYGFPWA